MKQLKELMTVFTLVVSFLILGSTRTVSTPAGVGQSLAETAPSRLPQTEGTLRVAGLTDDVKVVRDRWGIPHIYATNQDDLFFAQGFIQAQDRLFQMDLWRRSTNGYLAEVLGPDYVKRDRLSRLVRYRGSMEREWASYSADTKRIVEQFVRGINAWVEISRESLPVEFTMAGFEPDLWKPEDILSRSEAFLMSGNVTSEVFRAQLVAAVGAERAAKLLPPDPLVPIPVPKDLDLNLMDAELAETLSRIGSGASGFGPASKLRRAADATLWKREPELVFGSNNWVVEGRRSLTGSPLLANDPHRALDHPSLRYIVHLNAPGWNVIGAIQPWLPGVAFGHNERIAWGCTLFRVDAQDLYIEKLNPENPRQYQFEGQWVDMEVENELIEVDRSTPVEAELLYTRHGPVVMLEPEENVAYVLRWTGAEPGTAAYLGGIAIDRATNWAEFRSGLERWKMPGENFVYADIDGNIGYQAAALTPIRDNWPGLLPVTGWSGDYEWQGWFTVDDLPHEANTDKGVFATANHNTLPDGETRIINYEWSNPARINRIREVFDSKPKFSAWDFQELQHDSVAWNAEQLVPLLKNIKLRDRAEKGRQLLLGWDHDVSKDSPAAALYVIWEEKLQEGLFSPLIEGELRSQYMRRAGRLLVPILVNPTPDWMSASGSPEKSRNELLRRALEKATKHLTQELGDDMKAWRWGNLHSATFRHPLATDDETGTLLNVGPFPRDGYGLTVFMTGGRGYEQTVGASYRQIMDVADWDRSVGTTAPGQSGQPASPHFDDLAKLWSHHEYFPLSFSDDAVERNAENVLTLAPATGS